MEWLTKIKKVLDLVIAEVSSFVVDLTDIFNDKIKPPYREPILILSIVLIILIILRILFV
tara:strand:+ start:85 stop:264 length:180 start_codon:yes stop_codon:yes gene_type:complete